MRTPPVFGLPPPALMPPPVRPLEPVPIDVGEVCKLRNIECGDPASKSNRMGSRLGGAAFRQAATELDAALEAPALSTASPSEIAQAPVPMIEAELDFLVHVDLVPPKQLRCRVTSAEGAVLARWQCSEDELDLFTGCVAHAVFVRLAKLRSKPDPGVELGPSYPSGEGETQAEQAGAPAGRRPLRSTQQPTALTRENRLGCKPQDHSASQDL